MNLKKSIGRRKKQNAFTLVEVTLALGILAFALTTLIAILPIGLDTNRDSRESTSAMRTAALIASDLRQANMVSETVNGSETSMYVSPRYEIRLEKNANAIEIPLSGNQSLEGGNHRAQVQVLQSSPDGGEKGCYEVMIDVVWGLPGSTPIPNNYSNCISIYAAVLL
ncbi:MAG: prepilin-type N-terminal cleavage/methylation domain-containing protein [Verrucomicrobiota bacterium]